MSGRETLFAHLKTALQTLFTRPQKTGHEKPEKRNTSCIHFGDEQHQLIWLQISSPPDLRCVIGNRLYKVSQWLSRWKYSGNLCNVTTVLFKYNTSKDSHETSIAVLSDHRPFVLFGRSYRLLCITYFNSFNESYIWETIIKDKFNSTLCHSRHWHYSIITLKGNNHFKILTLSPGLLTSTAKSISLES